MQVVKRRKGKRYEPSMKEASEIALEKVVFKKNFMFLLTLKMKVLELYHSKAPAQLAKQILVLNGLARKWPLFAINNLSLTCHLSAIRYLELRNREAHK